jgi:hypothetical protein
MKAEPTAHPVSYFGWKQGPAFGRRLLRRLAGAETLLPELRVAEDCFRTKGYYSLAP